MTLTQLTYIVAVDSHRNFSQAAESCHVTQPTLSMQIQKLEEELGVEIFDRSTSPIKPTPLGQAIIAQARLALREADRIPHIVSEARDEIRGKINLAIIPTLGPYLLPSFLKKFVADHPEVDLRIEELKTAEIIQKLRSNSLDYGIVATPLVDLDIRQEALFYEPFVLYVSELHRLYKEKQIDEKDLSAADVLLLNEGHCFREQALSLCRARKKNDQDRHFYFESGSLETIKKIVDQNQGMTLLPWLATQDVANTKRLKTFSNPVPTREISLVSSPFDGREALRKAIFKTIHSVLPKEVPRQRAPNISKIDIPLGGDR